MPTVRRRIRLYRSAFKAMLRTKPIAILRFLVDAETKMSEPVETKYQQGPGGARNSQQDDFEDAIDMAYGLNSPYSVQEDMSAFSTGENAENEKTQSEMVSKGSNDDRIRIWTDEVYKNTALLGEKGEAPETDHPSDSGDFAMQETSEKPSSGEKKGTLHHRRQSSQAIPADWPESKTA
ncbi:hypothetical protein KEM56_003533 [Ascosphaera pollenicola]|nr:hypothetical protein KEM56_003533 [Ascosphaera pollenicola]